MEDGEWRKAESFFEQVLNLNAECGDAYLGKVLAAVQVTSLSQLREKTIQLDDYKDFSRAIQFSSGVQLQALQWSDKLLRKKWQMKEDAERRRREEELRLAEEQQEAWQAKLEVERHRKEEAVRVAEEQRKDWITRVSPFWKTLREQGLIAAGLSHTVGVKSDGTVITVGFEYEQPDWKNIVAVAIGGFFTVGLKEDGTVVRVDKSGRIYGTYRLDAQ